MVMTMPARVMPPRFVLSRVLHTIPEGGADDRALRSADQGTGNAADDRAFGTALRFGPVIRKCSACRQDQRGSEHGCLYLVEKMSHFGASFTD